MTPAEYKTQSATQEVNSQGNVNMYVVLKVCIIYFVGDWSNGMIGVSKTFGGSSILSSPAIKTLESFVFVLFHVFPCVFSSCKSTYTFVHERIDVL